MKDWAALIADEAQTDIKEIYQYIAFHLLEPVTAQNIVKRVRDKIDNLIINPMGYAVYDYQPWKSRGARRVNVGNFAVFYIPDETTGIITVIRVIYGRRNFSE